MFLLSCPPPFAYAAASAEFEQRWLEEIPRRLYEIQTEIVSERNMLKYSHGRGWSFFNTSGNEVPGEFQQHGNLLTVDPESRRNCEFEKLTQLADEMARRFAEAVGQRMMEVLVATTEKTGAAVTWKQSERNAPDVFMELLRKVEFGVTEDGQPSLPSLYNFPPAFLTQLQQELTNNPEFGVQVEQLKAKKIAEALARENERRAKFKKAR